MKHWLAVAGSVALLWAGPHEARAQVGRARGRVVDEAGRPVVGASVEFRALIGTGRRYTATSNVRGEYGQFLPPGPYFISITRHGYQSASFEFRIALGGMTTIPDARIIDPGRAPRSAADPAVAIHARFEETGALLEAGKLDAAEELLLEIEAAAPGIPEVHLRLAQIHADRRDWEAAEGALRTALALQPESFPARMGLSSLYERTGRRDEAIRTRIELAAEHPNDVALHYGLAHLCLEAKRLDEARAAFGRVAELDPGNADSQYQLASIAMSEDETARAVSHLKRYLELAPDGVHAGSAAQILPFLEASLQEEPR